jgi:hypothetical protein
MYCCWSQHLWQHPKLCRETRDIHLLQPPCSSYRLLPSQTSSATTVDTLMRPCCPSYRDWKYCSTCSKSYFGPSPDSHPSTAIAAFTTKAHLSINSVSTPSLSDLEPVIAPSPPSFTSPPAKRTRRVAKRRCKVELLRDVKGRQLMNC